jgi:hypothetical protein
MPLPIPGTHMRKQQSSSQEILEDGCRDLQMMIDDWSKNGLQKCFNDGTSGDFR